MIYSHFIFVLLTQLSGKLLIRWYHLRDGFGGANDGLFFVNTEQITKQKKDKSISFESVVPVVSLCISCYNLAWFHNITLAFIKSYTSRVRWSRCFINEKFERWGLTRETEEVRIFQNCIGTIKAKKAWVLKFERSFFWTNKYSPIYMDLYIDLMYKNQDTVLNKTISSRDPSENALSSLTLIEDSRRKSYLLSWDKQKSEVPNYFFDFKWTLNTFKKEKVYIFHCSL